MIITIKIKIFLWIYFNSLWINTCYKKKQNEQKRDIDKTIHTDIRQYKSKLTVLHTNVKLAESDENNDSIG